MIYWIYVRAKFQMKAWHSKRFAMEARHLQRQQNGKGSVSRATIHKAASKEPGKAMNEHGLARFLSILTSRKDAFAFRPYPGSG